MAEYNLSFWIVAQGLDQLKSTYKDEWETFINNAAVSTWIGLWANETPDYLTKLLGTKRIKYKSDKTILDEIRTNKVGVLEDYELSLQSQAQIREFDGIYTFISGMSALQFERQPYYEDEILKERADENPFMKEEENQ